jgi:hypothetical protein
LIDEAVSSDVGNKGFDGEREQSYEKSNKQATEGIGKTLRGTYLLDNYEPSVCDMSLGRFWSFPWLVSSPVTNGKQSDRSFFQEEFLIHDACLLL